MGPEALKGGMYRPDAMYFGMTVCTRLSLALCIVRLPATAAQRARRTNAFAAARMTTIGDVAFCQITLGLDVVIRLRRSVSNSESSLLLQIVSVCLSVCLSDGHSLLFMYSAIEGLKHKSRCRAVRNTGGPKESYMY